MFPASLASPHKYAHNTENIYLFMSNPDPKLLRVLNFKFCCTWVAVAPIFQGDRCGAIHTSGKCANISDIQRHSPKGFFCLISLNEIKVYMEQSVKVPWAGIKKVTQVLSLGSPKLSVFKTSTAFSLNKPHWDDIHNGSNKYMGEVWSCFSL